MAETTQANRSQNVTKQMKQKTFSLLVSGVIICAFTAAFRRNRPSPAARNRGKLTENLDAQWYNLSGFQALAPLLFATIIRFPYNKHFHELSALVDKFHTRTFGNYSGFPKETPELKFRLHFYFRSVANRSQVLITHAWRLTNEHMAWCNGGRREAFAVQNQHRYCV